MSRQADNSLTLGVRFPKSFSIPFAEIEVNSLIRSKSLPLSAQRFPHRPDANVMNESIPLFYIGQNRKGRWVVRESEGRSGGLFLFRQWATRFARRQSEPFGCAIMFLSEPIELEINSDWKLVSSLPSKHPSRQPREDGVIATFFAAWQLFRAHLAVDLAARRRNRMAIEQDLFGGQYTLGSKNDDDLPISR